MPSEAENTINVEELRLAKGMSVAAAAASVGVTRQTWFAWEREDFAPGAELIPKIAATLDVPATDVARWAIKVGENRRARRAAEREAVKA